MRKTVAIVFAGGCVEEMSVLTFRRPKSAVVFGGAYRMIDFALTNLSNTPGIQNAGILTQYRPSSLVDHIGSGLAWDFVGACRGIHILPPYIGHGKSDWYRGTADALYQNLDFLDIYKPEDVLIISGDHAYSMDYEPLLRFHVERDADVTMAFTPVTQNPSRFGIAELNSQGRIMSDIVHTWYAAFAGYMAKMLYNVPLISTVHSLEPLRPWKEEQLGNSYKLSSWAEKLALENANRIIAVSEHSKVDILKYFNVKPEKIAVIHNGIDLDLYRPINIDNTRKAFNIGKDYILFVGRTSRQKRMIHLINAMQWVNDGVQCVCCTSAPDTKEIEDEISRKVDEQPRIIWINSLLQVEQYVELYSNARVFVCPSVYEPFGIINLESMACKTPVVASAVGGILETVVDGETGILVEPAKPKVIAEAVNKLLDNPGMAEEFGNNGRKRVENLFSWTSIAEKTEKLYNKVVEEWEKG